MKLIQIYECFCDETRLRILNLLSKSPLCVSEIQNVLRLNQVKISKHLRYLKTRGMVEARRFENRVIYSLPGHIPAELEINLRCLHDCILENSVFQKDLETLTLLEKTK